MSLADRNYMREDYHAPRASTILIGVLIAAFLVQCLLLVYANTHLARNFGLTLSGLKSGKIWQLLTFQFLHSVPWPWHVLFNCLGLFFFGRPIEERFGARKFLTLYFLAGTIGGLLQVLTTAILPKHFDVPVVGASAGVSGMLAIYCSLNPMRDITIFIYFIPLNIRAIYLLWGMTAYAIFGTIVPIDNVAHAAHLGGLLLGISYVKWFLDTDRAERWLAMFRRKPRSIVKVRFPGNTSWEAAAELQAKRNTDTEFISKEVDPILEKIHAHGMKSLTEEEKRTLESAYSRMKKR
jgi:membrane associated rhomboid family serine protease